MKNLLSRPSLAIFRSLLPGLLFFAVHSQVCAQTATVTYPLAVGRTGCTSGTQQVHFYTYNGTTNTLASITSAAGVTGYYTPQLRIGTSGTSAQRFTSNYSSISYNPADLMDRTYCFFRFRISTPYLCMEMAGRHKTNRNDSTA